MKSLRLLVLLATVLSAVIRAQPSQISAEDYPQWRGHNRDGSASAFREPVRWPDMLTRRWSVPVGEGYATPLLIGDTVYAFTRDAGEEGITALDARTGTTRWRTS